MRDYYAIQAKYIDELLSPLASMGAMAEHRGTLANRKSIHPWLHPK
jgi:hypothetical protein